MSDMTAAGPVEIPDPPNIAQEPTITDLPAGYIYRVTRYADVILREAFPNSFNDLTSVLEEFRVDFREDIVSAGGSKASHTDRFDQSLHARGWGKRNITISRMIDDKLLHATKGHEIDMFSVGENGDDYPGVALEVEWNNKDPFYDRDLLNFMALHREGAIGVGIIVTRGPELQRLITKNVSTNSSSRAEKFGASTTHWNKLMPRINLGGGGECPLILIGIEPGRVNGVEELEEAHASGRVIRPRDYDKI